MTLINVVDVFVHNRTMISEDKLFSSMPTCQHDGYIPMSAIDLLSMN